MAIEGFDYKEQYQGTADTTDYSFDFKIFDARHLHIYIQDPLGGLVSEFLGDDPTYVAGVTINEDNGGILSLASVLPNAYTLSIFLANDEPDQPTDFPNKTSFALEVIAGALDYVTAWGQRAAYLAQRALRLHDLDDIDGFDMRLPMNAPTFASCFLQVNNAGNGWIFGPTYAQLTDVVKASQDAALASEQAAANAAADAIALEADAAAAAAAALASQNAANAAAAAAAASAAFAATFASGIVHTGPFAAIAPNTNLNLPGEVIDSTKFTMVEYTARIRRGTTVYAKQLFTIFFRNGAWEIAMGQDLYADAASDHGLTFTVDSVTAQINAAVANDGGSNATVDLDKIQWSA